MSEGDEKTSVASLLPEGDVSEKSCSYSSCPEDIIIKEGNVEFISLKVFYTSCNWKKGAC